MPMRGLLNVAYYSGEGKRKRGCRPYISFRKSLLNLVRTTGFMHREISCTCTRPLRRSPVTRAHAILIRNNTCIQPPPD